MTVLKLILVLLRSMLGSRAALAAENLTWGAPSIQSELGLLGHDIQPNGPPNRSWRLSRTTKLRAT